MLLLWLATQLAVGACAIDEREFQGLVLDAQLLLDRGEVAAHAEALAQVRQDLPCLQFAPTRRIWATYLVNEAVQAFSSGEDWEGPLAAAVRAVPGVDRSVGPGHPMFDWTPSGDPPAVEPSTVPGLYVDGEPADALPTEGWHLIQRRGSNGWWTSTLMRGTPPEPEWFSRPIRRVRGLEVWAEGSVYGGVLADAQDAPASDRVADGTGLRMSSGVSTWVGLSFWSPVGLTLAGRVGLQSENLVAAAPSWSAGPVSLGVGIARTNEWYVERVESDAPSGDLLPFDDEGVVILTDGVVHPWAFVRATAFSVDLGVSGGWVPGYRTVTLRGGYRIPVGAASFRVGLRGESRRMELAFGNATGNVRHTFAVATLGVAWENER